MHRNSPEGWHGTTIVAVRKGGEVVVAGDGAGQPRPDRDQGHRPQGRRLAPGGREVVAGFAGSTADAFTLLERLEAKDWRRPRTSSSAGKRSSSPRTGAPTSTFRSLRRCSSSPTAKSST